MKQFLFYITLLLAHCLLGQNAPQQELKVGQDAPIFEGKLLDGKVVSFKKWKGNLILLDFWASWCGPCRQENPNVVKIYDELKDAKFVNGKRFMIVSVSLDRQEQAWLKAIEVDKLKWETHILDTQGEIATKYNVKFIPSAFLIDGKGKIVEMGEALRGNRLKETLSNYKK